MSASTTSTSSGTDPMTMRRVMGRFATGVAVGTTIRDGEPHGMTVNSLTSVSLEPPLLLVSLTTGARSTDAVTGSGRFAVSVLSARQDGIALRFARRGENHFDGLPLTYEDHTVPVVPGALAHLDCTVEEHLTAGDHEIVIGRVDGTCDRDGRPLAFLNGRFADYRDRDGEPIHWFF